MENAMNPQAGMLPSPWGISWKTFPGMRVLRTWTWRMEREGKEAPGRRRRWGRDPNFAGWIRQSSEMFR